MITKQFYVLYFHVLILYVASVYCSEFGSLTLGEFKLLESLPVAKLLPLYCILQQPCYIVCVEFCN